MNLIGQPIAVIGLGYVGLPLAVEFGKHFPVTGVDIKARRIAEHLSENAAVCWDVPTKAQRRLGWHAKCLWQRSCGNALGFFTSAQ